MAQPDTAAQIFNHELRAKRRDRALRRFARGKADGFLLRQAAQIAAEKLMDVNRDFGRVALIGFPLFGEVLKNMLPPEKLGDKIDEFSDWPDALGQEYDLILSGLVLQSRNDIPQLMIHARQALRPDGLFLSVLLGGESLLGLRRACFAADQARFGGILPRIAPMIDLQQAGGLLSMAGLAQPVVDRDRIKTNYRSLKTLVDDLRDIGETNALMTTKHKYFGNGFLRYLETQYTEKTEDGKFKSDFELIWMTGWAPHESQQKPLKPGSAKMGLNEALRNIRN